MPLLFHRRARTDTADRATTDRASASAEGRGSGDADDSHPAPASGSADAGESGPPRAGVKPKAFTPGKGRPTPKRREARKRTAEPPPKDRKEAYRRMRDRQKQERTEARAAMMAGDDRYLPPRDKGPERALVRNIVDARRNIGTWFFASAIVILIVSSLPVAPQVRFGVDVVWVVMLVALVIDSILLSRLVKRLVWQRYPRTTQRAGGLYVYAVMRSLTLRRMRIPAPQVSVGDAI